MYNFEQYEDLQLLALVREKGPTYNEAFNEIYRRYGKRLFSYCLFNTENSEDAKDLSQETWISFYKSIFNNVEIKYISSYLYGIASKKFCDWIKSKKSGIEIDDQEIDFSGIISPVDIQASLERQDFIALVKLTASNLSEKLREIFMMKWIVGLSNVEISEICGETVECVKKRSNRGYKEVITILQPIIDKEIL